MLTMLVWYGEHNAAALAHVILLSIATHKDQVKSPCERSTSLSSAICGYMVEE
ncbi:hypothetical protein RchiOBHm_Chr5g0064141 [Rosa chinensis]|uniref:Uncharacterized protein n=1 Tax=Rosa chinensis TaxID=74649 RepID=A0A2P6QIM1_ROSCH|nr:hypothetical protein RchiOBHm_Chr5g0064141 [Rosa chinensis]